MSDDKISTEPTPNEFIIGGGTNFTFDTRSNLCPIHGAVTRFQVMAHETNESGEMFCHTSGDICPKCYVDWIAANITRTTPRGGQ